MALVSLVDISIAFFCFLIFQIFLISKKAHPSFLTNWPFLGMLPGLLPEIHRVYDFLTEELKKLVYLHGAICEALRLYPPVPFQHKSPTKTDVLPSGHKVDAGSKILFCLYSLGRMKSVWGEDALEFKPERWITENGTSVHEPSYKFLSFNAGPRTCLGKEVAMMQIKTVAVKVIQNYVIKVVEGHKVEPAPSVILHMKHGLKVTVSKRCLG
ncbi:hypothetical protein N665_0389s0023 [Sinapis alba]|nr:hypothetical protein N665_0389s0023 [Sinapis alba]